MSRPTPNFQDLRAITGKAQDGMRLDQALADLLQLSRRRSRRAIDEGGVYLNRKRCRTAGRTLTNGDTLRVVLLDGEQFVLFSSDQLIWQQPPLYLIHKRSGQYAQEALHRSRGTLPDELTKHLELAPQQASSLRPVHRLDRGTSGLMLFSSSPARLQLLQKNWNRCTSKQYLAVVEPAPIWDTQHITLAIDKQRDQRGRFHVSKHGRACETDAQVIERRNNRALLSLILHTGRTHQLRVHLAASGCPILGDIRYGGKDHTRLMLHAEKLTINISDQSISDRPASHQPALPDTLTWNTQPEEDWQW
ncbi:MAG: RluA family pseudouridine synthase [Mariprofundus sp.]|nr:RluA family pseudouridine synthase [Mariprofundus sp.]